MSRHNGLPGYDAWKTRSPDDEEYRFRKSKGYRDPCIPLRSRRPTVWQNPNGTWSHHRDAGRGWTDITGCQTDLRFHEEHSR